MKILISALILLFNIQTVQAFELDIRPTDAELKSLPGYCRVRLGSPAGSPEWKNARSQLGENFMDIHHYCFALNAVNRYWSSTKAKDRSYYLSGALGNFQYMIDHEKPNFPYWGELYSNMGDVHKLLKNPGEAIRTYSKAIEIDPTYARAYMRMSDIYRDIKSPGKALDIVTEGLRHNPDTKSLQRRYMELGGKLPYPAPIAPIAPAPVEAEAAKTDETPANTPPSPVADTQEAAPPEVAPVTPPPIGTPNNPYCRFCPD